MNSPFREGGMPALSPEERGLTDKQAKEEQMGVQKSIETTQAGNESRKNENGFDDFIRDTEARTDDPERQARKIPIIPMEELRKKNEQAKLSAIENVRQRIVKFFNKK